MVTVWTPSKIAVCFVVEMEGDVRDHASDHGGDGAVFVAVFPIESEDDWPDEGGFESAE